MVHYLCGRRQPHRKQRPVPIRRITQERGIPLKIGNGTRCKTQCRIRLSEQKVWSGFFRDTPGKRPLCLHGRTFAGQRTANSSAVSCLWYRELDRESSFPYPNKIQLSIIRIYAILRLYTFHLSSSAGQYRPPRRPSADPDFPDRKIHINDERQPGRF